MVFLAITALLFSFNVSAKENKEVKVSVVVPIYNVEQYLGECLESICNQSLKEIEILCVNDGSKDNSLKIAENYAKKDKRIKVFDKPNGGVSSARNMGIDKAVGQYVMFADSDDTIDIETCEVAYGEAKKYDADITAFGWRNFPPKSCGRKDHTPKEAVYTNWFKAKTKRESINVWNKLYKCSFLKENNLKFNTNIKYAEDELFNLCAYPFAKKIVSIPKIMYNYRVCTTGATFSSFKNKISNYINVWKYAIKFWKLHNIEKSKLFGLRYIIVYKDELIAFIRSCF